MRDAFSELGQKIGPYRLYDLAPGGKRMVCRVCGAHIRRDVGPAQRHRDTEIRKHGEPVLKATLQARLKAERSMKRRDEVRYRYATNTENATDGG